MYHVTFPQQSNRADWVVTIEAIDADSNGPANLTGMSFRLAIENDNGQTEVQASTDDGQIVVDADDGTITWTIRAASLHGLCSGNYNVGLLMTDGTATEQILLGKLPIVQGIPR